MTEADLPAALAIAEVVHPNYPEDPAVFTERLALYPRGCLVLVQGRPDDRLCRQPPVALCRTPGAEQPARCAAGQAVDLLHS